MRRALVTGSAGLVGSECVRLLLQRGWDVTGVDNDMRRSFFGDEGSTLQEVARLATLPGYHHRWLDIRDRQGIRELVQELRPAFVIHTAGQPSHDRAATIPYDDFDVNAVGTLNLLVAARDYCPEAPFCFTSTNKVYGDRPNYIPVSELDARYEYRDGREGVDEKMDIDQCLHSLLGASKLAADVLCQEFGRYFGMPVGVFRAGCITGASHAGVELHGYLAYVVKCAVAKRPYKVLGYKGKQVRDQIHSRDLAALFLAFFERPRAGEVYNIGGGRQNNISILETISALEQRGFALDYSITEGHRKGDHICYVTDLSKIRRDYPEWEQTHSISTILDSLIERNLQASDTSDATARSEVTRRECEQEQFSGGEPREGGTVTNAT
jgi:CDP-paratose 2-epimerase